MLLMVFLRNPPLPPSLRLGHRAGCAMPESVVLPLPSGERLSPVTGGKSPLVVERFVQADDYNYCYNKKKKKALKFLNCVAVPLCGGIDLSFQQYTWVTPLTGPEHTQRLS